MSRNTKIILSVVLGASMLCGIAVLVVIVGMMPSAENVRVPTSSMDLNEVTKQVSRMVEYDLPPGYREISFSDTPLGETLMIAKSDVSVSDTPGSVIVVMQPAPMNTLSQEEMQHQLMMSMMMLAGKEGMDLEFVGSEDIQIAHQETGFLIYEGLGDDGDEIQLIVSGFFQVNGKQTMVVVYGLRDNWPAEDIEAFVQSIR